MSDVDRPPGDPRRIRIRRWVAVALVVLASLSMVGTTMGVWTKRTLLDTERFAGLAGPLAARPNVQEPLAEYLTDQAFVALDVEGRVEEAVEGAVERPELAAVMSDGVTQGLRTFVEERILGLLRSDAFQRVWTRAVEVGHQKAVALVREDYENLPNVTMGEAEVRLNLIPLITGAIRSLVQRGILAVAPDAQLPEIPAGELPDIARERLQASLGTILPEDFGQVTVMSEDRLSALQDGVATFDRFVWILVGLSVVLVVATLIVSPTRRRTVIQLAIGVVLAHLLGWALLRRLGESVVLAVSSGAGRQAAGEVLDATIADLRLTWLLILGVALAIGVAAYLAGRPAWAVTLWGRALRRRPDGALSRWITSHGDGLRVAGWGVSALVLFWAGLSWVSVIITAALLGLYLFAIERLGSEAEPTSG